MKRDKVNQLLWDQIVELTFDCFYASTFNKQGGGVFGRIKERASILAMHAREGLRRKDEVSPFWLERTDHILDELELQLVLAKGLGVLGPRAYEKLRKRTRRIAALFGHPLVLEVLGGSHAA